MMCVVGTEIVKNIMERPCCRGWESETGGDEDDEISWTEERRRPSAVPQITGGKRLLIILILV